MPFRKLSSGLALVSLLGCAHTGSGQSAPETPLAARSEQPNPPRPVRVMVTGSRIPSYVEPGSNEPATYAPLRIYTRDALNATGRDGDVGAALRALDPSVTIHR
jgi:hypothetical protein